MILQGRKTDRLSWKTQLALTVLGLLVLPLAMTAANADSPEPVQKDSSTIKTTAPPKAENDTLTVEQRIERIEEQLKSLPASSVPDSNGPIRPASGVAPSVDSHAPRLDQHRRTFDGALEKLNKINGEIDLCTSIFNRKIAAEKQVEAVEAAFDAGTVTLDLVMDAQRRELDANYAYAQSLLDVDRLVGGLDSEMEWIHAWFKLTAAKQARDKALRLWQKVHKQFVLGKDDGKLDAVAREQYFFFRKSVQAALLEYHRVNTREPKQAAPYDLEGAIKNMDGNHALAKTPFDRSITPDGTGGKYQAWQSGSNFQIPIALRRELSAIRHQELQLAKERALLQDAKAE